MKVCPKCEAVNQDKNKFCANCEAYLSSITTIDDKGYLDTAVKSEQKRINIRNATIISIVGGYILIYNIWAITKFFEIFHSLEKYWIVAFSYIPCCLILFAPYDKIYCYFRRKMNKPEKHLSDFAIWSFRIVGVILLFILYDRTFSILASVKPEERIVQ